MSYYTFKLNEDEYYISEDKTSIYKTVDNQKPESQRFVAISFLNSVGVKTYGVSETTRSAISKIIKYLKNNCKSVGNAQIQVKQKNELPLSYQLIQQLIRVCDIKNKEHSTRQESNVEAFIDAPHYWFLGVLMDIGVPYKKAWEIPYEISKREFNGDTSFDRLLSLNQEDYNRIFDTPPFLHRYKSKMAKVIYLAVNKIHNDYNDDVTQIWNGVRSSAEVVRDLKEFYGVGNKLATMCVNILHRDLNVKFADLRDINVSTDVHVNRVFYRLGLTTKIDDSINPMKVAKILNPDYPGVFDLLFWMIGEQRICVNELSRCRCNECPLDKFCIKNNKNELIVEKENISNKGKGDILELKAKHYFEKIFECKLEKVKLEIGVDRIKEREFDLGNLEHKILIECKNFKFTAGDNIPSGKISDYLKEVFKLHIAPKEYKKILCIAKSTNSKGETLLDYIKRTYYDFLPDEIDLIELDII